MKLFRKLKINSKNLKITAIRPKIPFLYGLTSLSFGLSFGYYSMIGHYNTKQILDELKQSRPIDFKYFDAIDQVGGWTNLHQKAYEGNLTADDIEDLTAEELDTKDGFGQTPLFWAIESGQINVVRLLLEKGADPKQTDNLGRTLFHVTTNPALVPILMRYGVEYMKPDKFGKTAIDELNRHSNVYNYDTDIEFKNKQKVLESISDMLKYVYHTENLEDQ